VAAQGGPFTAVQAPFTEATFATSNSFLGGVAFAPNGDVWADECYFSGSPLHRFSTSATYVQNGSTLHQESIVSSNAGCGLTNGPGGQLYSNTSQGVSTLDASTGAPVAVGGQGGNALGIAVDPQDGSLVYPDAACRSGGGCPIDRYDPATGQSTTFANLSAAQATFVDGVAFDPSGQFLALSTRAPFFALTILDRTGAVVQQVPISSEPDGISFHWSTPQFIITNNNDGTVTRYDFAGGDLTATPTVSTFASGGFRGDLSLVGADGCAYLTQGGTRYADGTVGYTDSVAQLCPGFTPSTGVSPPSGPAAQVLFLHGVTEKSSDDTLFNPIREALKAKYGKAYVSSYDYYQDSADVGVGVLACDPTAPGQQTPPIPDPAVGMPYDSSQNGAVCDSEGDLGQNAARLDAEVQRLYQLNHVPVILMGYSMGGETIRSFLAYSTHEGDGVASTMVDSVVLLHGVEQGSWIANGGPVVTAIPFVGTGIGNLIGQAFPNPNRPAVKQFAPISGYMRWVDTNSNLLPPNVPTYNTWGDERIAIGHCFVLWTWGCVSTDAQTWGDVVLKPGTDTPTDTPLGGGERFLPGGYSPTHWQWAETNRIVWDPTTDPLEISGYKNLLSAPEMHMNYPTSEDQLTVKDCAAGGDIGETQEMLNVIKSRMNGKTYPCGGLAPSPNPGGIGGFFPPPLPPVPPGPVLS
jgi:hypothetical protein